MTFAHSKDSRVFLNAYAASGVVTGWSVASTRGMGVTTTLLDSGQKQIPGLFSGSLAVKGLFDSAQSVHANVIAALGVDNSINGTVFPYTTDIGSPALMAQSDPTGYTIESSVSEAVGFALDTQADDGVDMGLVLHAYASIVAGGNDTGQDNGAATANGGVAMLHVTAYATLTNLIVKVQHSTDNSVWADLATFTTATGITSERKLVAAGTTVNRYVRALWTVTGSGSASFVLAFARR